MKPCCWLALWIVIALSPCVKTRFTLEIAALGSERCKLKEKVEMFQRQVQFLQREGVDRPRPPDAEAEESGNGAVCGRFGDGDGSGGGRLRSAESPGFASLFDARRGDDRYLQVEIHTSLLTGVGIVRAVGLFYLLR